MGRPPKFTTAAILAAAGELGAETGVQSLSVAELGRRLSAPSGSLYHRFPSRAHLLAELWLDAVDSFQTAVLAPARDDPEKGVRAAFAWARAEPVRGRLLLVHHRRDFEPEEWPPEIRSRAAELSRDLHALEAMDPLRRFGWWGIAYAALRECLVEDRAPGAELEEACVVAGRAVELWRRSNASS